MGRVSEMEAPHPKSIDDDTSSSPVHLAHVWNLKAGTHPVSGLETRRIRLPFLARFLNTRPMRCRWWTGSRLALGVLGFGTALGTMGCAKASRPQPVPQFGESRPPPAHSAPTPCQRARSERERISGLLATGNLDRSLRVIARANQLCAAERETTVAVEVRTLAEIGHYQAARALAHKLAAGENPEQRQAAAEALALIDERDREFPEGNRDAMGARLFRAGQAADALGNAAEAQRLYDRAIVELELMTSKGLELDVRTGIANAQGCAWSLDGTLLAVANGNRIVVLERRRPDTWPGAWSNLLALEGHDAGVRTLTFSSDSKTLATASYDGTAHLWDVDTGRILHTFDAASSIALSPDALTFATGLSDHTLQLWETKTGRLLRTLPVASFDTIAFSPDGKLLAARTTDETVQLWDHGLGKLLRTLGGGGVGVGSSVAFSPDGRMVASIQSYGVAFWETSTGRLMRFIKLHTMGGSLAFSPDGSRVGLSSLHGTYLWNVKPWKEVAMAEGLIGYGPSSLAFSPDGSTVAVAGSGFMLWQPGRKDAAITFVPTADPVRAVAFAKGGTILGAGGDDQRGRLWSLDGSRPLITLEGHSQAVSSLAFAPLGQAVVTGSHDRTLRIWSTDDGSMRQQLAGHGRPVTSATFSPKGDWLVSGAEDGTIRLWDSHTGSLVRSFQGDSRGVLSVAVSPDGTILAFGEERGDVQLLKSNTGDLLARLVGHVRGVRSLAFGPNGKLASGSLDRSVRLWSVPEGRMLHLLEGHADRVEAVALAPTGRLLASGSMDHTICLWDSETGERLRCLTGHEQGVTALAFSADSATLASGSEDASTRLWDVASGTEMLALHGIHESDSGYAFTPDGYVELLGKEVATARVRLGCRVGPHLFPFELCAERFEVEGLLTKVLARDPSYRNP